LRLRRVLALATTGFALFGSTLVRADKLDAAISPIRAGRCYEQMVDLFLRTLPTDESLRSAPPYLLKADGTQVAISSAFEKEGRYYSEIAQWFDTVDHATFVSDLRKRLAKERAGEVKNDLTVWLYQWVLDDDLRAGVYKGDLPEEILFDPNSARMNPPDPEKILNYIAERENPFDVISVMGREEIFEGGFTTFDALRASEITPPYLTVGNDLGSYEVRSNAGVPNLREFNDQKRQIEEGLEGKVGHVHNAHAWHPDAATRTKHAPQYIDLLDSTNMYLYWRQANRNPDDLGEAILSHPYLGLYTKSSLNDLHAAVVAGDAKAFKNKYRFVGARSLPGDPNIPGQVKGEFYPDFELRSGNKRENNRSLVEHVLKSRIATGDYSGLNDFRKIDFDTNAPTAALLEGKGLTKEEIKFIENTAREIPLLRYQKRSDAMNHFRNKFLAPLFPWQNRLKLGDKVITLEREQKRFARELYDALWDYKTKASAFPAKRGYPGQGVLGARGMAIGRLEKAVYEFGETVRLDKDFERVLMPKAPPPPSIQVKVTGPIDVNKIDLGIESSFRFPARPLSADEAERQILAAAEQFKAKNGGGTIVKIEKKKNPKAPKAHGHGLSIQYVYTDLKGRNWRFEWDGILRSYREGHPYWTRGGHIEVPSPKFSPQNMDDLTSLYQSMRELNNFPQRSAGGAHINIDISTLKLTEEEAQAYKALKNLTPAKVEQLDAKSAQQFAELKAKAKHGARKLANLISVFESEREMTTALWQHPFRRRTGIMSEVDREFFYRLAHFEGDWDDLGTLLYNQGYFNSYRARKPAYMQLNVVGLMAENIPPEFAKGIDIKNPIHRWFPAFGGKAADRVEFRLFDAPEDEYIAALQIKYIRALLNKAWNTEGVLDPARRFGAEDLVTWKKMPDRFVRDASTHLEGLGLDGKEFEPALRESIIIQAYEPRVKPLPGKFDVRNARMRDLPTEDYLNPQYVKTKVQDFQDSLKALKATAKDARIMNVPNVSAYFQAFDSGLWHIDRVLKRGGWLLQAMAEKDRMSVLAYAEEMRAARRELTRLMPKVAGKTSLRAEISAFTERKNLLDTYITRLREIVNGDKNINAAQKAS
jgi:hypothetical protein